MLRRVVCFLIPYALVIHHSSAFVNKLHHFPSANTSISVLRDGISSSRRKALAGKTIASKSIVRRHRAGALHMENNSSSSSSSSPSQRPNSKLSSQYYLLSSLAVWKGIALNTCILFLVKFIFSSFMTRTHHEHLCHTLSHPANGILSKFTYLRDVSLPLLSSACCAIQLFLNATAGIGCAGFNTFLGPLRPYFVSILLFTTITSFSRRSLPLQYVAVSWVVAFMPEIVHITNEILAGRKKVDRNLSSSGDCTRYIVQLGLKDMGCVACINKIDGTLRKFGNSIIDNSSWLNSDGVKGGKAKAVVNVSNGIEIESITTEIVSALEKVGFQAEIESVVETGIKE